MRQGFRLRLGAFFVNGLLHLRLHHSVGIFSNRTTLSRFALLFQTLENQVAKVGLEPTRFYPLDFESNFVIRPIRLA